MKRHKQSWPFVDPVNKDDVPDYYDVITDPIGKITIDSWEISVNSYYWYDSIFLRYKGNWEETQEQSICW